MVYLSSLSFAYGQDTPKMRYEDKIRIREAINISRRIFCLRTILLKNRVLAFRDRWMGNDLEMSGVL